MVTISIAIVLGAGIFAAIWWWVWRDTIKLWGNSPMTFTPNDSKGEPLPFEPRHERYTKIAEVLIALASASLIFIPGSRLSVYPHSCAFVLILLGLCVFYGIGFMVALTYFYESFLYDSKSYKAWKYALVHALGFGGLLCFAFAYVFFALRIGYAMIYAAAPAVTTKALP